MSMSNVLENALLLLLFNATPIANIADNAASSPDTQISYAIHTSDPGEAGNQSTNETNYTSYARTNVNRNSGGHTVTANSVSPAANVDFTPGTGGSGTATHFSEGRPGGGTSNIHFSGTVTPNVTLGNGVTPRLSPSTVTSLD